MRQQRILLRLVEAMNLVEKQDRPPATSALIFRVADRCTNFLYTRRHRRQRGKASPKLRRQDLRQRRLACARWSPQNQRRKLLRLKRSRKQLSRPKQVLLTDELIEAARSHSLCQRCPRIHRFRCRCALHSRKEIHAPTLVQTAERIYSQHTCSIVAALRRY
jgi:hypothetical protein